MKQLLLVTGNQHKLREWQAFMPEGMSLNSVDLDLVEIQSADPIEIVTNKVRLAYQKLQKPVVVEDVSAGLDKWKGLPGPYIKTFIEELGQDALFQLANMEEGTGAVVSCSAAYFDGSQLLTFRADVHGTVVAPRGDSSFGFDVTFVPDGYDQTYAEMPPELKNAISHRSLAALGLISQLLNA